MMGKTGEGKRSEHIRVRVKKVGMSGRAKCWASDTKITLRIECMSCDLPGQLHLHIGAEHQPARYVPDKVTDQTACHTEEIHVKVQWRQVI